MGENLQRECETLVMEATSGKETENTMSSSKRRRVDPDVLNLPQNSVSPATSETSAHIPASELAKKENSEPLNLDLKAEGFETEFSNFITDDDFSRETSPSSELCGDSEEMEFSSSRKSTSKSKINSSTPPPGKSSPVKITPSAAEIEEFFAAAERQEQKRFAEKYNYDVVKDVPLEGRYQWIRLKP